MSTLQIKYFGWPKIADSASAPNKPSIEQNLSSKALALFIYLSVEQKEISRESLQTMFWRDSAQQKAASSLRVALNNLNKHLAQYINKNRQTVSFNASENFEIDIFEFRRVYDSFKSDNPDPQKDMQDAMQAVQLYVGDFLEGFYVDGSPDFESWLIQTQTELSAKHEHLLQWLTNTFIELRNYSNALIYAQNGIELNPLNEDMHRKLMVLYAKLGLRQSAIKQFQRCLNIFEEELGNRPDIETEQLFERIQYLSTQKRAVPFHDGSFVGRSEETKSIQEMLYNPQCRLLTVVGMGGIGKTTFVSHVVSNLFNDNFIPWLEGYRFVSLANVLDENQLLFELARVLNISLDQTESVSEQIIQYLAPKELLLIFDNYDHLVGETNLIESVLERTANVQILVTSREELSLKEEWVFELSGLHFPSKDIEIGDVPSTNYPSIELFNHVATRVSPMADQKLSQRAIFQFCQLVEGMPLAIELTASLVRDKSVDSIMQEIQRNLAQNKIKFKNSPSRHQTLFSCFEYTWHSLSLTAQQSLAFAVAFVAPFSAEAAEEVMQTNSATIELLRKKSFITQNPNNGYFDIHPLLKQFINEASNIEDKAVSQESHQKYYLELLTDEKNSLFHNQDYSIKQIKLNVDNIKASIISALDFGGLSLLSSGIENLGLYFEIQSHFLEGVDFLNQLLKKLSLLNQKSTNQKEQLLSIKAVIQMWLGVYLYRLEDKEKATNNSNESLEKLNRLGSEYDRYKILNHANLGNLCLEVANFDSAKRHYQAASQIGKLLEFSFGVSVGENLLGVLAFFIGDLEAATIHTEESIRWGYQTNDLWTLSFGLSSMSYIAYLKEEYHQALEFALQNLDIAKKFDHAVGQANALTYLGFAYSAISEFEQARLGFQECLNFSQSKNLEMWPKMALIGIADLWKRMSRFEDALLLLFVLEKYSIVGRPDLYQRHQAMLLELTSMLPNDKIEKTKQEAEQKTINDYIVDFLLD